METSIKEMLGQLLSLVTLVENGVMEPRALRQRIGAIMHAQSGWQQLTVNEVFALKVRPAIVVDRKGRKITSLERVEGWIFKCNLDGQEAQLGGMDEVYAAEDDLEFDVVD